MPTHLQAPVFFPTKADMAGPFDEYIESIEKKVADIGMCKIVAPKGWTPRRQGYSKRLDIGIPRAIRQHASGKTGLYRTILVEEKPMSLRYDFMPLATAPENQAPAAELEEDRHADLERRFWKNVCLQPPLYGADIEGTLFDKDLKAWNLQKLPSLLSRTLAKNGAAIPGVNTSYLYFGMWRSLFAWHTEDLDLASVNYLHYGASKSWYCIPSAHRPRFEQVLRDQLPDIFRQCPEFFRHKELLVSPYLLERENIPVVRMVQHPGEFVINLPGAYHCGFNHGYNCAESTNFATRSWIGVGMHAQHCQCTDDSVTIDMSMFLEVAAPRVRKELRQIIAARQLSESSSEESDSAASCSQESAGSVSAAESAAEEAASEQTSEVGGRVTEQSRPAKREAPRKRPSAPSAKRHRGAQSHVKRPLHASIGRAKAQPQLELRQATTQPQAAAAPAAAGAEQRVIVAASGQQRPRAAPKASAVPAAEHTAPEERVSSRPLRLAAAGVRQLVANLQALGRRRQERAES